MLSTCSDILPVIVIYRTPLREAQAYRTLLAAGAFRRYVVYDNSPADYEQPALPPEAVYLRDTTNGGLSKAYNAAARYAAEQGYRRLLLLDQDTRFPAEAAEAYGRGDRSVALWTPSVKTLAGAAMSPGYEVWGGVHATTLAPLRYLLKDYVVINSGMCVDLDAFRRAGGYNEAVRLDFADYQFVGRLRRVADLFQVLDFVALQDFSNEMTAVAPLLTRYRLYLESAAGCVFATRRRRLSHRLEVLKHTLRLTLRTGRPDFLAAYLRDGRRRSV